MRVLSFGEILWDLIDGVPHLGGAPFNFAAHCAKCGAQSFIVSSVGNDNLGFRALNEAATLNVDSSYVMVHPTAPTGTVDVYFNSGQPDYNITQDVAFDYIDLNPSQLRGPAFDVFYFGSVAQRGSQSARSLFALLYSHVFRHVFYDVNLRKNCWTPGLVHSAMNACSIVKLNTDELHTLAGVLFYNDRLTVDQFCRRLTETFDNVLLVIVTSGENGCYVFNRNGLVAIPGILTSVVDTIGAGDAFSAAFMYHYATNADAVAAARLANKIGAFVAASRGAIPAYPDEIKQLLRQSMVTQSG